MADLQEDVWPDLASPTHDAALEEQEDVDEGNNKQQRYDWAVEYNNRRDELAAQLQTLRTIPTLLPSLNLPITQLVTESVQVVSAKLALPFPAISLEQLERLLPSYTACCNELSPDLLPAMTTKLFSNIKARAILDFGVMLEKIRYHFVKLGFELDTALSMLSHVPDSITVEDRWAAFSKAHFAIIQDTFDKLASFENKAQQLAKMASTYLKEAEQDLKVAWRYMFQAHADVAAAHPVWDSYKYEERSKLIADAVTETQNANNLDMLNADDDYQRKWALIKALILDELHVEGVNALIQINNCLIAEGIWRPTGNNA